MYLQKDKCTRRNFATLIVARNPAARVSMRPPANSLGSPLNGVRYGPISRILNQSDKTNLSLFYIRQCSAGCGSGIQTRRVFCGKTEDDVVTKVDDSKCDPDKRYDNTTECHVPADQCKGEWFTSHWSEVCWSFAKKILHLSLF